MDYFPDILVITFTKHQDVLKILAKQSMTYQCVTLPSKEWKFKVSKIDFVLPVRNCNIADDQVPNKYMPIYVQKDKMQLMISEK